MNFFLLYLHHLQCDILHNLHQVTIVNKIELNILRKKNYWWADDLKNSMNVDNVLSGVSNDDVGKYYYRHSRQLLASAGMNLRQWTTNSSKLKEKLVDENTIATGMPKVLALKWDQIPAQLVSLS